MNATQILPFFLLVLLAVAVPTHAQSRIVANVPFDFIVHGQTFPAGNYEVSLSGSANAIALIDNLKSNVATFVVTIRSGGIDPAGQEPALVFRHVENQYFLTEIWESQREGELLPGPLGRRRPSLARATTEAEDGVLVVAANRM